MSESEQYAVLLNGRLVGDTPFVFKTRKDVERLVRLLGDLTGVRASAVQRGWGVPDAPPFDLSRVSGWLERYGPGLTRRGHQIELSDLDAPLPDLCWPPGAWTERDDRRHDLWQRTICWEGSRESVKGGAAHPSFLDGPEGSLWDVHARENNIDDWEVRLPRHLIVEEIQVEGGWIRVEELPQPLYGPAYPYGGEAPEEPEHEEFEWLDPPVGRTATVPRPPTAPPQPGAASASAVVGSCTYTVNWQGQIVGGQAFSFATRMELVQLLRALHGILPGEASATAALARGNDPCFTPQAIAHWLRLQSQWLPDADLAAQELLGRYGIHAEPPIAVPPVALTSAPCSRSIELAGTVVGGHVLRFATSAEADALQQALSHVLGISMASVSVPPTTPAEPFDLAAVAQWVAERGWRPVSDHHQGLQAALASAYTIYLVREQGQAQEPEGSPPLEHGEQPQAAISHPRQERENAIRALVQERRIPHLTHFTRVENVRAILDRGIMSRQDLGEEQCLWNDGLRLDRRRHANCLSISHPNYKMFYRYRQQATGALWAVLVLDPAILWELDCGFVEVNAASTGVPQRPEAALKGVEALEGLFANQALRMQLNLPAHHPTDPQAEVLVFQTVPTRFIREIQVNFKIDFEVVKADDGRLIPIKENHDLFKARHDYEYWRNPVESQHG